MIGFDTYLTEARLAPLYHGTNVVIANSIINENKIKAYTPQFTNLGKVPSELKTEKGVSLTRSYKFAVYHAFHNQDYNTCVVFELDQLKLTNNYKIRPLNYYAAGSSAYDPSAKTRFGKYSASNNEYEEFVIGEIRNLDRYITKIRVCSELTMETIKRNYPDLEKHPLLWDSTNALERGNWINK